MPETVLKCHLCFSAAAPKVSQSQAQSDIAVSKPFPVTGGHPVPESGVIQWKGLVHITVELPSFDMASVSSCRCHPSSGSGHYHYRPAAAHDRLSSQTCSSQAQENPPPDNRGVWLPHQWHVPVANQAVGWSERLGHWCGRQELDTRLFLHLCVSLCFLLSAVSNLSSFQVGKIMTVHEDSHTEPCQLVTLLLIVTAFKASNIIMFMTSFKCCPSEKLIVNVYQRMKGLRLIYAVSILR